MLKNVASQVVGVQMITAADGTAFTGSVTVAVTGDGGTQATGSVGSGACTHEGNGYHTYAPAQAETNYNLVAFTFTGTGAIPVTVQIYTRPTTGLLAPTTAGRTLDVTATGAAGIDWGNVENQATSVDLSATAINLCDTVTTNTDTAAELAKVPKSDGTATWNATALASINAECDTALSDYDAPTNTEMVAAFTEIKGATWATTDTLEAIRDRGDAAWTTPAGFATAGALDSVDGKVDQIITNTGTTLPAQISGLSIPSAATIADAVWDEAIAGHLTGGSTGASLNAAGSAGDPWTTTLPGSYTGSQAGKILADILDDTGTTIPGTITTLQGNVTDILTDTGTTLPAQISALNNVSAADVNAQCDTAISDYFGVAGSSLTGIPWNAAWDAEVQSEVKDALDATVDDAVPADGTRPSVSAGIYMLCQYLFDTSISGTTMTVRKPDGSTTLFTVTLNDGTTPTAKTRGS